MSDCTTSLKDFDSQAFRFYHDALELMSRSSCPFLLGGAYAFSYYTGIIRHTKDLDLFVRPADAPRALEAFAQAGYRAEMTFPHWLGKVYFQNDFIDIIFSSGNNVCPVDDGWFEHAIPAQVLGVDVQLAPVEEMIWQKAFIMERERFDGADVAHLLRARGGQIDWDRLLGRFGPHWRILFCHLVLFGFVYPAERARIPERVLHSLGDQLFTETRQEPPADPVCQGTLLSRVQYLADTDRWGYEDARVQPRGNMTPEQATNWTAAAGQ